MQMPAHFVPAVEFEALWRERQVGHIAAQREDGDQRGAQHPVQQDGEAVVAGIGSNVLVMPASLGSPARPWTQAT